VKLVVIIGNGAVGKMTVGQELAKITGLKLFHNHMSIEPVIEIFGDSVGSVVDDFRESVFKNFAKSDQYGLIFTYIWAFDCKNDWRYINHVRKIFRKADIYFVELVAPQEIRMQRNLTENRLKNKASKRDIEISNKRILDADKKYRLESYEGEIKFKNYIKIDNSQLEPNIVAKMIKDKFNL
jgi:hypothetical protein